MRNYCVNPRYTVFIGILYVTRFYVGARTWTLFMHTSAKLTYPFGGGSFLFWGNAPAVCTVCHEMYVTFFGQLKQNPTQIRRYFSFMTLWRWNLYTFINYTLSVFIKLSNSHDLTSWMPRKPRFFNAFCHDVRTDPSCHVMSWTARNYNDLAFGCRNRP